MHVCGLWEKAEAPGENPRKHRENMPPGVVQTRNLLDNTNHQAASPNQDIITFFLVHTNTTLATKHGTEHHAIIDLSKSKPKMQKQHVQQFVQSPLGTII